MIEPPVQADRLKVVIFDVDGTLYRQPPMRRAMLVRLLRLVVRRPVEGWRTFRTLQAYRRAQEELRGHAAGGDIAAAQIRVACERINGDPAVVARRVERWMEQEPLSVLPRCTYAGLPEFLHACRAAGLRLAAFSDYPAAAKLRALRIADLFDVVLCAQAPEVDAFKPHPRGLLVAMTQMGVRPEECLYVGDRVEVDAAAAAAAGMACVILTRDQAGPSDGHRTVTSYPQLHDMLFGGCLDMISAES